MFTAYSTQGQLKPRLILAEGFWDGLLQAAAYLWRESVRINALKRCPRLAEAVNDCCAWSVFNYIPDLHGWETRVEVAQKWVLFTFTKWKMADRDSCKKRNVWSAPEEKQILLICSELEIAGTWWKNGSKIEYFYNQLLKFWVLTVVMVSAQLRVSRIFLRGGSINYKPALL